MLISDWSSDVCSSDLYAERRGQLVQFRHAVGLRALEPHHGDEVAVELTAGEGRLQVGLVVEDTHRRLDDAMLRLHGGSLDHRAAEIAVEQLDRKSTRLNSSP